ncbi:hypothetical protein A3J13_00870 [Candidatus Daviesbacteria bacterium RIFCSPLOWO2_02_FULL_36_8]|uniref:Uncharacterized protein n=1 Tax=Candidatus Daviesbacteria bacterium RIFCSPLOWO2_02_FULL_36_8 TaxID=1797793 RepID=A0A1F5MGX3_9BACT|nr:MAG: hypothetical protein A3J13_00870 [Candidatus Daviesbacteria bacterium RIFCSPLOWO2_02_FULL_36_8]
MKPTIPPVKVKNERELAMIKAQEARDKVYKLMIKIISWESGALDSYVVKSLNKITNKEWSSYKKNTLAVSTNDSLEKVKARLAKTYKNIKEHGGFK